MQSLRIIATRRLMLETLAVGALELQGWSLVSDCDLCHEFVGCDFGDDRLSKRALKMADVFENDPVRSIPSAFITRADWEACYRFFDNPAVTPKSLIETHI